MIFFLKFRDLLQIVQAALEMKVAPGRRGILLDGAYFGKPGDTMHYTTREDPMTFLMAVSMSLYPNTKKI
jgi:hypothetical protein